MKLLTSQRNAILELVKLRGFDPREFSWEVRDASDWAGIHEAPTLIHTTTGFFCSFATHTGNPASPVWQPAMQGNFTVLLAPGINHECEQVPGLRDFNANVIPPVRGWLDRIRQEDVPDQWEELASQRRAIAAVVEQEPDNAPFTKDELARVDQSLHAITQAAERLNLAADDIKRIGAGVVYLREAAERMGRKDWFLLAVTMLTWAVPVDKAVPFAHCVFQALQWVVHTVHLLP